MQTKRYPSNKIPWLLMVGRKKRLDDKPVRKKEGKKGGRKRGFLLDPWMKLL